MANEFKYFSGDVLLNQIFTARKTEVAAKFPGIKAKSSDSFDSYVGNVGSYNRSNYLPVTRIICYKVNGTKHECGSRCRSATGHNCECSCGGKFHGIDS